MKNYVKPSIELNKFDVEDIITVSGTIGTADTMSDEAVAIYEQFKIDNPTAEDATNLVEFQW